MVAYGNYYLVSIFNVLTVSRNCTKLQLWPIHPIQSSCQPMSLVLLRWSSGPGERRDSFPGYSGPHSSEPFWTSLKPPWDLDHITHLTVALVKRAHSSKHLEAAEKHAEALRVRQEEQATEDNRSELRGVKFRLSHQKDATSYPGHLWKVRILIRCHLHTLLLNSFYDIATLAYKD